MITLSDISNSNVDESNIIQAYSHTSYILEVMKDDKTIKTYKYEDIKVLHEDMEKLNDALTTYVLCG